MTLINEKFDLLSDLSVHGVHQIGRQHGVTMRKAFFWTFSFLLAVTLLGLQMSRLVSYLQSYPTVVSRKTNTGMIDFPTVTFCSLGMVKKSIARKIPVFQNMQATMSQFGKKTAKRRKRKMGYSANPDNIHINVNISKMLEPKEIVLQDGQKNITITTAMTIYHAQETFLAETINNLSQSDDNYNQIGVEVDATNSVTQLHTHETSFNHESIENNRPKRSVAHTSADTCNTKTCENSAIQISHSKATVWDDCYFRICGDNANAYAYTIDIVTYMCSCYSVACCGSPYAVYNPYAVGAIIGRCDDIFPRITGTTNRNAPYYATSTPVTYTCVKGTINAKSQLSADYTCTDAGVFQPTFSPCTGPCLNQFSTATGLISSPAPYLDGIYTFTCKLGYFTSTKSSSDVYTCKDLSWDKTFSPCQASCPNIFALTTGSIQSPPYYNGNSFVFACQSGYLTAAKLPSETYTCNSGGIWDKTFSSCIATCANIFVLTTGSISPAAPFMSATTYTFTCKGNFLTNSMLPSQTYTCSSGIWDLSFTPCYPVCPNIFDSTGSAGSPPFMGFPKIYTFSCISGYLLPNYATTQPYTCGSDGNWNIIFTSCLKECQLLQRPQIVMNVNYNGPIVQNLIPSGVVATFTCAANYSIFGTFQSSTCYKGSWDLATPQYPTCLADCDPISPLALFPRLQVRYNHTIRLIHGSFASFSCNQSYFMYGDFINTTCVNGSWNVAIIDFPICLEQQVANYDQKTLMSYADPSAKSDNFATGSSLIDMMSFIMSNLSESMKISMGFSMDDTLVSCTYGDRICDKSLEIMRFNDNSMGNCYSFNHKNLNESIMAERPGEKSGLYWILNTKQEEFLSMIATGGTKLIVHQPFEPIFPDSMGIAVSPGFIYSIALQKQRDIRVSTPLAKCFNQPTEAKFYFLQNSSYGVEACQRSLQQSQIISHCGCASPNLPVLDGIAHYCSLENRTCVVDYVNKPNGMTIDTNTYCPAACQDYEERMVVTMTASSENGELYTRLPTTYNNPTSIPFSYTKDYVKSNLVSVKVYYQTLDTTDYVEEISYSMYNLLSDFGSSMGLLAGMSVISIVELIVTLVQLSFLANM